MLFTEYRFFKEQSAILLDLQEEYRNYLLIFRRVCDESQKEKSDEAMVDSELIEEKKNSFIVINRQPEYLKKSFINYLKERKLENKLDELQHLFSEDDGSNDINFKKNNIIKKKVKNKKKKKHYISLFNKNIKNDGEFMWPVKPSEFRISSFFGNRRLRNRKRKFHHGIDLAANKGTEVMASRDGLVMEAFYHKGFGNTILIMHDNRYKTRYAHLHSLHVKKGERVKRGQKIGKVGDTGHAISSGKFADHLHFEVIDYGKRINPLYVLQ